MTDDEVDLVEIGGRKVLMLSDDWIGYQRDHDEYGTAIVEVDERGVGAWVPIADLSDDEAARIAGVVT